ncbi:MAG: glycine oxidase [Flavobacteriales bacterium]|jgi:glycine oxidase
MKIAIVGAGIMGRSLAWKLLCSGHYNLSIYDRDPINSGSAAAYTAAGMLAPYGEIESAEDTIYRMGLNSLKLWPKLIEKLGGNIRFHDRGSLIVAHPQDRADLARFNQKIEQKIQPSAREHQHLDQRAIAELEPELASQFSHASYFPEEAWVCTQDAMDVYAKQLLARGVDWRENCDVTRIAPNRVTTHLSHEVYDWVFDCRGLGAKQDMPELRGVRGEVLCIQAPEVSISRLVRLMHPRYSLYLAPQLRDDIYMLGATQIESDDTSPISVRSALELLSALFSLHPGFSEARILETKTNCRPALPDNLPRIVNQPGLTRINGLYRHGFLLAPTVAEEACNWFSNQTTYRSAYNSLIQEAKQYATCY